MTLTIGDIIPDQTLVVMDKDKGPQPFSLLEFSSNKKIVLFGVPGAFTKVCSAKHLPGFVKNYEKILKKGVTKIVCISVNDPNVMKAWGENQKVQDKIFMAADPFCEFTKLIGAAVDKSTKGLGIRSERYSMYVENGIMKKVKVETDTANCELSAAENFLKEI